MLTNEEYLESYAVKKKGFFKNVKESLPIGDGDCGANVYLEKGRLRVLFSKTDSMSEAGRLLKTGLLEFYFVDGAIQTEDEITTVLSMTDGSVHITLGTKSIDVAAFRGRGIFGIRFKGFNDGDFSAKVRILREKARIIAPNDDSAFGFEGAPFELSESADVLYDDYTWYHYNDHSYVDYTRKNQHIPGLEDKVKGRVFGGSFKEAGKAMDRRFYVRIASGLTEDPKTWARSLENETETIAIEDKFDEYYAETARFWSDYFGKNYLYLDGCEEARTVSRLFCHSFYFFGCASEGVLPFKFNGSIFSVTGDPELDFEDFDYRRWGGETFWIQNTRLQYWALLYAGHYSPLRCFFKYLYSLIPICEERVRVLFGHGGILLPETFTFYGSYADNNFGYGQESSDHPVCQNRWIRAHYNGQLELSYMMLKYLEMTGDKEFFDEFCLPFVNGVMTFFKEHSEIRNGKLYYYDIQALETWQHCINDTPDIAGLYAVTKKLVQNGYPTIIDPSLIPDLPHQILDGKDVISPCEEYIETFPGNCENPELYPLFPFDIFDLNEGIPEYVYNTYDTRINRPVGGWSQALIFLAYLGRSEDIAKELPEVFDKRSDEYLFDAYFGPNFDWVPDMNHASSNSIALMAAVRYALPKGWHVRCNLPFCGKKEE